MTWLHLCRMENQQQARGSGGRPEHTHINPKFEQQRKQMTPQEVGGEGGGKLRITRVAQICQLWLRVGESLTLSIALLAFVVQVGGVFDCDLSYGRLGRLFTNEPFP